MSPAVAPDPAPVTLAGRLPTAEIFAPTDYRHRLRLGRGDVRDFFGRWHADDAVLAERRRWLSSHPHWHALATPASIEVLRETVRWFAELGLGPEPDLGAATDATKICVAVGGMVEADLLWLTLPAETNLTLNPSPTPPTANTSRLIAGAVAFPSSWAPESKLGLSLREIHGVVPELNKELADPIDGFLSRLRPGVTWLRANWGLSASSERNQHPARALPRLQAPLRPESTWVRIEHQALTVLPRSGAILFGIRIENVSVAALAQDAPSREGLARALRTMPEPMARYKGLAAVREELLALLEGH